MKVYIGAYKGYWSLPWIEKSLIFIGIPERKAIKIVDWVSDKINYNRKRTEKIRIDDHDVWSLDYTLCMIIHPSLIKLKEIQHGFPFIEREDVPEHLLILDNSIDKFSEGQWSTETEKMLIAQWNWILDEMIWAFSPTIFGTEDWSENLEVQQVLTDRKNNGRRLFAKYFHTLWD